MRFMRISTIAKPTRGRLASARRLRRLALLSALTHEADFETDFSTLAPVVDIQDGLREIEDLRSLPHELRQEKTRYLTVSGRPAGIVYDERQSADTYDSPLRDVLPSVYPRFENPGRVLVCIRRKQRRQSLFAMRKVGKGRRKFKRPVWSAKSHIKCK